MPRGGKRGGRVRAGGIHGRQGGGRAFRQDNNEIEKHNELYEQYYNENRIVSEDEREIFWAALRKDLPNSFRFTGSKAHALPVQHRLRDHYIPEILSMTFEGQPVKPPEVIPWYPDQLAWQMSTPKNVVRKYAPFASFKKFLISETSVGSISRQEVVSMIPPLLLGVQPHHTVLDLCAAPGSKSAQLIEAIHASEEAQTRKIARKIKQADGREISPDGEDMVRETKDQEASEDWSDDGRSTGLLVANDVDYKRAHMLIHQMKRLNSPNLIVTNHDATHFPSIKLPSEPTAPGKPTKGKYLKFDRILADVPCSGDGTSRKNNGIWRDWRPLNGLGLHVTQVRILVRALQMLKVGGRVVYSTCSMNPAENEAVVASAIDRCGGLEKVELVDCSAYLPQLKRKPGLKTWQVMDKSGHMWSSWADVELQRREAGLDGLGRLAESMFPPTEENEQIPLERCMRVYAHQQDTGAFFITVLQKKSEIKARAEHQPRRVVTGQLARGEPAAKAESRPSIVEIANAIENAPAGGRNGAPHIQALDAIAAPPPYPMDGNASAAARQNMDNDANQASPLHKRQLEDVTDAYAATKKPKVREDLTAPSPPATTAMDVESTEPHTTDEPEQKPLENGTTPDFATPKAEPDTKPKKSQHFEEPFKYLHPAQADLAEIFDIYNLHPRFPRDRFMVRNSTGHPAKTIYYTSSLARNILQENEGKGIKFVHCGVKMFVKQDVQRPETCRWRVQTEGLPILESWVSEQRIIRMKSRKTLRALLVEMFPKFGRDSWQDMGEIGEKASEIDMGCHVLVVEKSDGEDGFRERMVFPFWRSLYSVNLMLPKEDRKALLLRLFNEDVPLLDNSLRTRTDKGEERQPKLGEVPSREEQNDSPVPGIEDAGDAIDVEDAGAKLAPDTQPDLERRKRKKLTWRSTLGLE